MLTSSDISHLESLGITAAAVDEQIRLLREGFHPIPIDRPCRFRDGIEPLREEPDSACDEIFAQGRLTKFVPASGAASRMFEFLHRLRNGGGEGAEGDYFFSRASDLPFFAEWKQVTERAGGFFQDLVESRSWDLLVDLLLDTRGLGYSARPKGLIPFHIFRGEPRTAMMDHMAEMSQLAGASNTASLHFTVQEEHRSQFEQAAEAYQREYPNVRTSFSVQDHRFDTVALDATGDIVRDSRGRVYLRPGGHGALLSNLQSIESDIVWIRNIDNIAPPWRHEELLAYSRLLLSHFVQVRKEVHEALRGLDRGVLPVIPPRWRALTKDWEELAPSVQHSKLREFLDRPLRVCGMVPQDKDPGGGPYWITHPDGTQSVQIVEVNQIATHDPVQRQKIALSSHFNPVDMVCGLRDYRGQPFDLQKFSNPSRYLVTRKSYEGNVVSVLEWPGLWNGAMEHWLSVFVELPRKVFNPVKSALDLLRPAHQMEDAE